MLTFDEDQHRYHWNGQPVPNVTTILQPLSSFEFVDPDVLEAASELGTNVHTAIEYMLEGDLDWPNLDSALVPYVKAADKWLSDTGAEVLHSELRMYHEAKRYAGTTDLICYLRSQTNAKLYCVDWKTSTTVQASVGPQTYAYQQLYKANYGKTPGRLCIQLRPDGSYRMKTLKDRGDAAIWQSCLNLHRWWETQGSTHGSNRSVAA